MSNNKRIIFRAWYTSIDSVSLVLTIALVVLGIIVSITSTMPFAAKRNIPTLLLAKQHFVLALLSIPLIISITFIREQHIRSLSVIGYFACIATMIMVAFYGLNIKGATRWIKIAGFSLQPSEFLKPVMAVLIADLLSKQYAHISKKLTLNEMSHTSQLASKLFVTQNNSVKHHSIAKQTKIQSRDARAPYIFFSFVSIAFAVAILMKQPDFGMSFVLVAGYSAQLFAAGMSIKYCTIFAMIGSSLAALAYAIAPHIRARVDAFLFAKSKYGISYQLNKALNAIKSGGLFGKGGGNGIIKQSVPDMHSDFVFAVIAEEFGIILCIAILVLFIIIVCRSLFIVLKGGNMFKILTVIGLSVQVLTQIIINVSSSIGIIPTKGTTLHFFSYGGSAMMSSAISFGIILSMTRKR